MDLSEQKMKKINSEQVLKRKRLGVIYNNGIVAFDNFMISTEDEQAEEFTNLLYRHRRRCLEVDRQPSSVEHAPHCDCFYSINVLYSMTVLEPTAVTTWSRAACRSTDS